MATHSSDNAYIGRTVTFNDTSIEFSTGKYYNGGYQNNPGWAVPYHIWGVKHLTIK